MLQEIRAQALFEEFPGPEEDHAHLFRGQGEPRGDLPIGQGLQMKEPQGLALALGQGGEGFRKARAPLGGLQGVPCFLRWLQPGKGARGAPPAEVDRAAAGDLPEVGGEGGRGPVALKGAVQKGAEDLRGGVGHGGLGIVVSRMPQGPAAGGLDDGPVFGQEALPGGLLPRGTAPGQVRVVGFRHPAKVTPYSPSLQARTLGPPAL